MDKKIWVNKGDRYRTWSLYTVLDEFAAKKGGKHVVDCAWFGLNGGWTNNPVSIYYVPPENRRVEYKNTYFGLNYRDNSQYVRIFNVDRIEEIKFCGRVVIESGEFIFSRWRHDFRHAQTAGFAVDGGLDYFRAVGSLEGTRSAVFGVRDGQFVEIT